MNAQFSNPRSIKLWPSVGRTYSCNSASCSNTKYVGKASSKGIKLNGSLAKKDYLYWKVDHSVGIPISKAYPNIDYWYSATAQPHSLRVRGRHDKAPSHE